jgi:hypothetical protein
MRVAKQEKKEGHYGDVPVYRCVGDFGVSVFYRPGRHYRPEASSLNRTKIAGKERVRFIYFDRFDLDGIATQACGRSRLTYERPDFGLDAQHSNVKTRTTRLSAGIVFRF